MRVGAVVRMALGCLLFGLAGPAAAASWPPLDLTAFTSACQGHSGLNAMVATAQPSSGTPAIARLCTCFAARLESVSQSDADLLTKDLLGTTTDAERQAYETYEDLSSFAGDALDSCMVSEGFRQAEATDTPSVPAIAPPPAAAEVMPAQPPVAEAEIAPTPAPLQQPVPVAPPAPLAPDVVPAPQLQRLSAEATGFLNACVASVPFGGYLGGLSTGDAALQGTICSCMTGTLVDKVAAADLSVLARDFSPDSSAPHDPAENYGAIAQIAQDGLRACMRDSGITPDF